MSFGFRYPAGWFWYQFAYKKARYVPRLSDTSETVVSSVIKFSHTSMVLRAASIRSAAL